MKNFVEELLEVATWRKVMLIRGKYSGY